jgi:UDP-2,4-diacetamido-2,4,6-trideoxy-beta-L-altropyranose hydrolase
MNAHHQSKRRLLVRADAGLAMGTGHVMRCLALAQAWADQGGDVVFVCVHLPEGIAKRLRAEGFSVCRIQVNVGSEADAAATLTAAREHNVEWVAVDGYAFTADYLEGLQVAGFRVLALDDMGQLARYPAEVVLNQNLSATAASYDGRIAPDTTLLLGTSFSLLRREFRRVPPHVSARTEQNPRRVLITLGGADGENFTAAVLRNLERTADYEIDVIVLAGAANKHVEGLERLAAQVHFSCVVVVDAADVAVLMGWADVAITGGGSTLWELAALRVPALIGAAETNQLAGLSALKTVPFFRAMRIEEMVTTNIAAELALLCADDAVRTAAPFDAEGALRVVRQLKLKSEVLIYS